MASAGHLHGRCQYCHHRVLPSEEPANGTGEEVCAAFRLGVLGAEPGLSGKWPCQLRGHSSKVFRKKSFGADWVEDTGGE